MSTLSFDSRRSHPGRANMAWSIVMILAGIVALAMPFIASIAVAVLTGWLMVMAGGVHLAFAMSHRSLNSFAWKMMTGIFYLAGGLILMFAPLEGVMSLTLVVGVMFLVEGVLEVMAYFSLKGMPGAAWFIIDGVFSMLLGLLVWASWPTSSTWVLGILLGVNLMASGITRIAFNHQRNSSPSGRVA